MGEQHQTLGGFGLGVWRGLFSGGLASSLASEPPGGRKTRRYKALPSSYTHVHTLSRRAQTRYGPTTTSAPRSHTRAPTPSATRRGPASSADSPPPASAAEAAPRGCALGRGRERGRGRRAAGRGARARGGSARPEGRLRRPGEGLGAGPRLRQSGAGRREGRAPTPAPWHTGAHAFGSAAPESRCRRAGKGPQRLRVGVRSPARTRLLVLLVEFFNHLGRLPSAQTHRNRPRRRSRRAEETAGRPAPCSGAGWVAVPSLGEKARPPPAVAAALVPWGRGHALSSSPSRAEAGLGAGAPGLRPGPCSDRLELGAGPGPERAECDFIRLARTGR